MYDCEHFRQLIDEHPSQGLDEVELAALEAHLGICEDCRRLLVASSFTAAVLEEAPSAPEPPAGLAAQISSAARTHLRFQRRPIHQKALGSPAFFATCASLLCGAAICLLAIWRMGSVPVQDFTAVPVPGSEGRTYTRIVVPAPRPPTVDWERDVQRLVALLERDKPGPCASLVEFHAAPHMVTISAARTVPVRTAPLLNQAPGPPEP